MHSLTYPLTLALAQAPTLENVLRYKRTGEIFCGPTASNTNSSLWWACVCSSSQRDAFNLTTLREQRKFSCTVKNLL